MEELNYIIDDLKELKISKVALKDAYQTYHYHNIGQEIPIKKSLWQKATQKLKFKKHSN